RQRQQLLNDAAHLVSDAAFTAVGRFGLRDAGQRMKAREIGGHTRDVYGGQLSVRRERGCQRFLRELPHLDRGFGGRAGTVHERPGDRAPDRNDIHVERGSERPVQAQLFLAEMTAELERAEIEKGQLDGLLDLVGVWSRQHDPRDVGLDDFYLRYRM